MSDNIKNMIEISSALGKSNILESNKMRMTQNIVISVHGTDYAINTSFEPSTLGFIACLNAMIDRLKEDFRNGLIPEQEITENVETQGA